VPVRTIRRWGWVWIHFEIAPQLRFFHHSWSKKKKYRSSMDIIIRGIWKKIF
jgi:hypothetical protein